MLNLSPYMCVNKIEATYKVSHVNVQIKRGFTFARDLSYLDLLSVRGRRNLPLGPIFKEQKCFYENGVWEGEGWVILFFKLQTASDGLLKQRIIYFFLAFSFSAFFEMVARKRLSCLKCLYL